MIFIFICSETRRAECNKKPYILFKFYAVFHFYRASKMSFFTVVMTAFLCEFPCCKDIVNRKLHNKKNALFPLCCYYFGNRKFSLIRGLLHNTVYLTVNMPPEKLPKSPQIGDLKFWNFELMYLGEYLLLFLILIGSERENTVIRGDFGLFSAVFFK